MNFEKINVQLEEDFYAMTLPPMLLVKQHFNPFQVSDLVEAVNVQIKSKVELGKVTGKRIAITAGSRGIKEIDKITLKVIEVLKSAGAKPFVVPAMGSHGGATAQGQKAFIEHYGITEEAMGVPIVSSMETVLLGHLEEGIPVYCDRAAYESDGIVIINKIKPHADFKGSYESGLVKMLAIGLGKHKGASYLHQLGFEAFAKLLPRVGKLVLERAPVLFGLALVENAYDEAMLVEALLSGEILKREPELLRIAKENMPKIKLDAIDVLIVDEIGKNISGEGMDPNVTGRPGSYLNEGFEAPAIEKIVVLDVTAASRGNGVGLGMADVSTIRCANLLDLGAMYTNAVTATILGPARLPLLMNHDREAILIAMKTSNQPDPSKLRLVRIKNTLEVETIQISEAYYDEIKDRTDLEIIERLPPLAFDQENRII